LYTQIYRDRHFALIIEMISFHCQESFAPGTGKWINILSHYYWPTTAALPFTVLSALHLDHPAYSCYLHAQQL
jgi:hypothetical protein